MADLLELALEAHGGLERWKQLTEISATAVIGGGTWTLKQQEGFLTKTVVTIDPHSQHTTYKPLGKDGDSLSYEPSHVAIFDENGSTIAERYDPRQAFEGHAIDTPWDNLHAAYFSGYAMWNYLTIPFLFTHPGFEVEEIEPWVEDTEKWRRLRVRFPADIATHNETQTFYFGPDNLLRRHDYSADIFAGSPVAHYTQEHKTFGGISFPTRRRVLRRRPDGTAIDAPVAVTIDIESVSVR